MIDTISDRDIEKAALYDCLRPEIRKMAHAMENKFRLYDRDRGNPFQPLSFEFLSYRFDHEWDEFMKALGDTYRMDECVDGALPSEVWKEAADCCNFILMMAVNYQRRWMKEKS